MVIYGKSKDNLFIPIFTVIIFALSLVTPIKSYVSAQTTNTDALTNAKKVGLTTITTPEKISTPEISVPTLGKVNNYTPSATQTTSNSAEPTSACPNHTTAPTNTIAICGRIIPIQLSATPLKNATPPNGLAVQNTTYNVLYGHNSYDVFGDLYGLLTPGSQFAVNINNINVTYTASSIYTINTDDQFASAVKHLFYSRRTTTGLGIITCAPGVTYNAATNTTSSQNRVLILANPS